MSDLNTTESPIASLTEITKDKLALMLDGRKIISSDDGLPRDWRGLAQCLGYDLDVLQQLGRSASPVGALLDKSRALAVSQLWRGLAAIGRLDVQDDTEHMIAGDVARYQERLTDTARASSALPLHAAPDSEELLCVGDAECLRNGQPLPTFDAFLLYDDGDAQFAAEIIKRMEARGVKLCDKERHLLPGVSFEHQGIIRLMETRCHRVLAVLSPSFLQSAVNKFLAMFAQALGLDKRGRMLLPCVYQKCALPSYLMYCSRIDFTRGNGLANCWEKMFETLSASMAIRTRSVSSPASEEALATTAVARPAKLRSDSSPCCVPAAAEPPQKPTELLEPERPGRGLLRRLLPRGRHRASESSAAAETVPAAPAEHHERRGQLAKLFSHATKDKHQKHKNKGEKKKAGKTLVAA